MASLALAVSFVVYYLVYAYRFMWYLSYPDFVLLVEIYLVFAVIVVIEFIFAPTWWFMGCTAFALMFMLAVSHIKYLLPMDQCLGGRRRIVVYIRGGSFFEKARSI